MRITRYALIGIAIGLVLLLIGHPLIGIVLIAAGIAIPALGYAMLSPEQRRRLREQRRRRQIGS